MAPQPELAEQLEKQRRKVDFDTFDIHVRQLLSMLEDGAIDIAPVYQRQFRWDAKRCSQLIESLFLGIPVPSLFMATNKDATWELVDGVQRINTLVKFAGTDDLRQRLGIGPALRVTELDKLTSLNGRTFAELPATIQLQFGLRPVKVVTLSDKSDPKVRFDLFERLNSGGIALTDQEIRSCVYRGPFNEFLDEMAKDQNFKRVVRLTKSQEMDGTREECVLRFFAFLHRYKKFVHSVTEFLNDYMSDATKHFDYEEGQEIFEKTFLQLANVLHRGGIVRPDGNRRTTPLNLYEGVAVGAALALQIKDKLRKNGAMEWLAAPPSATAHDGRNEHPGCSQRENRVLQG